MIDNVVIIENFVKKTFLQKCFLQISKCRIASSNITNIMKDENRERT